MTTTDHALTTTVRPADPSLGAALRIAAIFALIKLLLQFACTLWSQHLGYGYFRDEFYYIACGHHLAWGFVDHGPIVAVQARVGEMLFGESVFAIRILSALLGAIAIALTGVIACLLGGGRMAQILSMTGLMFAGVYLGTDGYLSMNSWEPVFWMVCVAALLFILRGHSPKSPWIIFGISAGIGLLNKPSMTFFLIALGLGLLCTPQRRLLISRWAALGIALLVLIALPNLLWQIHNQWPTLEFLHNGAAEGKNVLLKPVGFFLAQVVQLNPWNALIWMTGLVALLSSRSVRNARWLGLTYLFFFAFTLMLHAKDYYLAPIYPFVFAAGAIAWERHFALPAAPRVRRAWVLPLLTAWLVFNGLVALPFAAPVLAPETFARYAVALHFQPPATENAKTSILPQFYADRFGWESYATQVVGVYRSLAPAEQRQVCIFTDNYGEAGAIDFLGHHIDPALPPAISGHNSYWMWGPHGCTGDVMIVITGDTPAQVGETYEEVQIAGRMDNQLAMPYERKNIYLVRHRRPSRPFNWDKRKHYI